MQVSLNRRLEAFVREQVDSGRFDTADAVVQEALQLLEEHHRLHVLRAAAAKGFEQLERGEGVLYTPELFEAIKRRAFDPTLDDKPANPDVLP